MYEVNLAKKLLAIYAYTYMTFIVITASFFSQ